MAQKKKAAPKAAKRSAEDEKAASGSDALTGAVYLRAAGRVLDHKKASDQKLFKSLAEKEGALAPEGITDKEERKAAHKEALQRLTDQGVLKGYGTKAASKKKSDEEGGEVLTLTEKQALEQQAEEEDE